MNIQRLTKAEEDIMVIIWKLGPCTVSQIIAEMGGTKPPHSTISSIVRILEKKEFLSHKAYGRTYEYFPIIEQKDYSKFSISKLASNYFKGSMQEMVSFLVKEEEVDIEELKAIINQLDN